MNFCWAGVYSAYKILGLAEGVGTGAIVTLRFGLAAVCMLLFWPWYPGAAPRGRHLWVTCLMGLVLFVLGQRMQVYGNEIGTAGNSSVLMAVEPLVTSVAAALFLREHLGPRRVAGFCLGLFGVLLLNRVWEPGFKWVGMTASAIFVGSFLCEAAYSVAGKPIVARFSVMKMLTISLLVGTAANLLIDGSRTWETAAQLSLQAWLMLLAMAVVCTGIGYSVWFLIIRECPVNVVALTIFSQSIFGVVLASLWVGETLHWGHLLGSLAIVAGLVLGLSRQIQRAEPPPTASTEA